MKKILSIALAGLIVAPVLSTKGAEAATNTPCQSKNVSTVNISSNSAYQNWVKELTQKLSLSPTQLQMIKITPSSSNQAPAPSTKSKNAAPQPSAAPAPKQSTQAPQQAQASQNSSATQQSAQSKAPAPAATNSSSQSQSSVSAYEQKVVDLTNQERSKQGLPALKINTALSKMARDKSADMRDKGYFSHQSPTYGSPFDMMNAYGIKYSAAGENIAAGQPTPQAVVTAWMNSPGHRANILSKNYTEIGVGYVKGGSYGSYWTQEFIGN